MLKLGLAVCLALAVMGAALAQAPTDCVKIDVSRAELQAMGQGIMKLPYEKAAPLLIELQKQLEPQTTKAQALAPAAKPEDKPAAAAKQ
jgi:hypothetical protein